MQNDDHRLFALSCLHYSKTEKLKRQDRASFFVLKSQGESAFSDGQNHLILAYALDTGHNTITDAQLPTCPPAGRQLSLTRYGARHLQHTKHASPLTPHNLSFEPLTHSVESR